MTRTRKAVLGTVGAILVAGSFAGGMAAQASSAVNTTNSVNTLISPKCYLHQSTTTDTFHWVSKAGAYQMYTAGPHHSHSYYITCHS